MVLSVCFALAVVFSGFSPVAAAQAVDTAQLGGVVRDSTGAVVPGAAVTVTNLDRNVSRTDQTSSDGSYTFVNLTTGAYQVEVKAAGFRSYVQKGIVLTVGASATISPVLTAGAVTEEVTVQAVTNSVELADTATSQVVDSKQILSLPLNGRQITSLVLLSGVAVNASSFGDTVSTKTYSQGGSVAIAIAGGQANAVNYVLDGGDYNDSYTNVNLPFPFPDATDQFSIQTSGVSARYGVHSGGTMNAVTRSGSNVFHGSLFEFARNGALNALNYFSAGQDTLVRNQFGGTLGGPVLRNRLFFFGGYQGTRSYSASTSSFNFVPTAAVLAGDFSAITSAACVTTGAIQLKDPATGANFVNNQIPTSRFVAPALALLKYVPTSTDPCGKNFYSIPNTVTEDQYLGRVDLTLTPKQTMFARYLRAHLNQPPPSFDNSVINATVTGVEDFVGAAILGHTWSITPNFVNSLRLTANRINVNRTDANGINANTLGIPIYQPAQNYLMLSVSGFFSVGSAAPAYYITNTVQVADDVDVVKKKHHLMFGFNGMYNQLNYDNINNGNGAFTFNGSASKSALVDMLLGVPSTFTQGNPAIFYPRQKYIGAYFEDEIHMSPRLTIHAGVRWEPFLPAKDKKNTFDHFYPANFAAGIVSQRFINAPPGLLFEGDKGVLDTYAAHRLDKFAPRVGVAFDPFGDGKSSIRASYGLLYDYPELNYASKPGQGAPFGSTISLSSPANGFVNPFSSYAGGNPFPTPQPPTSTVSFVTAGQYFNIPQNLRPMYQQIWSLSIQRELPLSLLITGTYLGSRTNHIWGAGESNPAVYIPGTCGTAACSTTANTNQRRILYLQNANTGKYFANIFATDDSGGSTYNALLLSVNRRSVRGVSILANYTYSHCLSDANFAGSLATAYYEIPFHPEADYGNCVFDVRNLGHVSVIYTTPAVGHGLLRAAVGRWTISPLLSMQSGSWYSPVTGADNSRTGVNLDRPNIIGNPYLRNNTTHTWLNPASFQANAIGTFGNAGAYSLVGPGAWTIDAALSRVVTLPRENFLEFRLEGFNALNHVNYNNPTASLASSNFGKITSAGTGRVLQLAAKYTF
jgi:hypothetical protein